MSADRPELAAPAPLPPLWWRLYNDRVLDSLVQQALTHNEDLKVAAANLAYAQGLLEEARAGQFPTTDLTAAGPGYGRSGLQVLANQAASTVYSAGFTASYQVDIFGRIRRGIPPRATLTVKVRMNIMQQFIDLPNVPAQLFPSKFQSKVCTLGIVACFGLLMSEHVPHT